MHTAGSAARVIISCKVSFIAIAGETTQTLAYPQGCNRAKVMLTIHNRPIIGEKTAMTAINNVVAIGGMIAFGGLLALMGRAQPLRILRAWRAA